MPAASNPHDLNLELKKLARAISEWVREKVGNVKSQIQTCRTFLVWIDRQYEIRDITIKEEKLHALIKRRFTFLAVLEEDLWKQRAHHKWQTEGDRNTSFFHFVATNLRQRNHLEKVKRDGQVFATQKGKSKLQHFCQLRGKEAWTSSSRISWSMLYLDQQDLTHLSEHLTIMEVKEAIKAWPLNRAPGPDGFTGEFYKKFIDLFYQTYSLLCKLSCTTISLWRHSMILTLSSYWRNFQQHIPKTFDQSV